MPDIIIVEDNKELRQYLVNGLSPLFCLLEAENGKKILAYME